MIEPTTGARPWHPLADLFPLMPEPELAALAADIRANGQRLPITTYRGAILDGRNRVLACERAGVEPRYVEYAGDDPLGFIVSTNLQRRHLSASQCAMAAAAIATMRQGARTDLAQSCAESAPAGRESVTPPAVAVSQLGAARLFGVSRRLLQDAAKVRARAPELVAEVNAGRMTVPQAVAVVNRAERRAAQAALAAVRPSDDLRLDVADAAALPLAGASVDLIVTSPPYGLGKEYGTPDDPALWPDRMAAWLREMYRVAREGGRLALNVPLDTAKGGFRDTYPTAAALAKAAGWQYRSAIVWNEGNITHSVGRGSVDSPACPYVMAPVEIIALFSRGGWKRDGEGIDLTHDQWLEWTNGLWTFGGESRPWEGHPAPFPEELPRRLIKLLSFVGDTVLDPFCGSGTTAVVAMQLGRKFCGCDLNPDYVASARRRLAAEARKR